MLCLLKQIPDAVWAAIIASLLTLGGVHLANRNSRKQHREALEHDARQRDREREMSLRREVYLKATEAISKCQNFLMRLSNIDISEQELATEFSHDSAAIAKIHIVGTNNTVQAVSAFLHEWSSVYLELALKRIGLIERKKRIESLMECVDKFQKEMDRYVELMKQLNLEGNTEQRVWKVVKDNFEFERTRNEKCNEERKLLQTIQNKERLQFVQLCVDRFLRVSQTIPPAVFAVREELEMKLDKEAYLKMHNENIERSKVVFDSFLNEISGFPDN